MKRFIFTWLAVLAAFLFLRSISPAQHQHGAAKGEPMKMDTKELLVEGVRVAFRIMPNKEHNKMLADMKMKEVVEVGSTHTIAVSIVDEKTNKEMTNAEVNMKAIDPAEKPQIKALGPDTMMKYCSAYFSLSQKGENQVLIVFKIGDQKRTAGIY